MHKFIEIKKSDSANYLDSGYFVITNVSGDWIHLTTNLHYVRKNAVVAVSELDSLLEKQESKGFVKIERPTSSPETKEIPADSPSESSESPKKSKKPSKVVESTSADEQDVVIENMATAAVVDIVVAAEEVIDEIKETPANADSADENKDVEVQETA